MPDTSAEGKENETEVWSVVEVATNRTSKTNSAPRARVRKTDTKRKVSNKTVVKAKATASAKPTKARSARPSVGRKNNALSSADLEKFKQMLLTKREQLLGDVEDMEQQALKKSRTEAAGDLSSMPIHMADIGTDNYEQEFTLGLVENEHGLLREIEEALSRIEAGTYGICLATGKRIPKSRLKFKPWAKYCVAYVRASEKNNHNNNAGA